jgi:hypothetical protein
MEQKHIFGPRTSGRTYACMEECFNNNAYLLLPHVNLVESYQYLAKTYGFEDIIPRIISINEIEKLPTNAPVVIDNADYFLSYLFSKTYKSQIVAYSFCTKDLGEDEYIWICLIHHIFLLYLKTNYGGRNPAIFLLTFFEIYGIINIEEKR